MTLNLTVIDIVEHARRPGRYLLTLSDKRVFTVSVTLLAELGLTRKGVELAGDVLERLERETDILRVMDRAVAAISRARRTRRELELRLRRVPPGIEPPEPGVVKEALDRLAGSGVLSDDAVARAEASSRLRRGDAPRRVQMILQQKGIGRSDASAAVAAAVHDDSIDEEAQCLAVADKRMRALAKLERPVAKRRLMAFLLRRGYSTNSVRLALRKHFAER